ncbi:MAG: cold-shock protein, partial [Bacillales bacterium]
MRIFIRKGQADQPDRVLANTVVYVCSSGNCNGWMREEFATDDLKCPLCGHDTVQE